MSFRLKYEIYASNGTPIDSDIISSVSQPLIAFAEVDWQQQLESEIQLGKDDKQVWPAHMILTDQNHNYLRIEPSPNGLSGLLELISNTYKFGLIPTTKSETIDFSEIELSYAGKLIKQFVLGNFEEIKKVIQRTPKP